MYALSFIIGMMIPAAVYAVLAALLMRLAGKKLLNFRPAWRTAFPSNFGGFFLNQLIGLGLGRILATKTQPEFFKFLAIQSAASLVLYVVFALVFLRNRGDQRPSLVQAIALALIQLLVGVSCAVAFWFALSSFVHR